MTQDQVPWHTPGWSLVRSCPTPAHFPGALLPSVACSELHGECNHWQLAQSSGWVQPSSYRLAKSPIAPQQCCALCPHPTVPCGSPEELSSPGPFYRVAGILAGCVLGSCTTVCTWTLRHQNRTRIYCISVAGRPDPGVYMGCSCPGRVGFPGNGGEASLLEGGGL